MDQMKRDAIDQLKGLSSAELAPAMVEAIQGRPEAEKKAIAEQVSAAAQSVVGEPSQKTRNRLWMIVVSAFAIVLVGSFVALAVGVFVPIQEKGVKPELILTTFTSVVGFLAGLFTPSPVARSGDGGNG